LKKRSKKLLLGGQCAAVPIKPNRRLGFIGTAAPTPAGPKVFWFFFAKKNLFLAFQLSGPLSGLLRCTRNDGRIEGVLDRQALFRHPAAPELREFLHAR
jgi:hypothetical protein